MVILVKVLEKLFKKFVNLFINPGSILKLDHEIKSINHGQMFKAELIFFQIVKHHADDTHNLFLVEVIENFRDMLNNVKLEIGERIHSEVMIS